MKTITVREYARLTMAKVDATLDQATVSASAFDWLCRFGANASRSGSTLLHIEGRQWLRLDNYVGIIETPCGTRLEILPKHQENSSETAVVNARKLLCRMLKQALDLPSRDAGPTDVSLFEHPLTEWIMRQFLQALDHLIKRGVRFEYQRIEEEQRFLRGQLDVVRQMRQPPGRQHIFNIRHDVFLADRAENRLLKSALLKVCAQANDSANWRLSHELATLFSEIPESSDIAADFRRWRDDRLMAHYLPVKPWCELVLGQHIPLAVQGDWRGFSLLFPMEKLFERYIVGCLKKQLPPGARLITQAASQYLCRQNGDGRFQLRPDLLIEYGRERVVLDTKWKLLNAADKANNFGLSQSDFYQMFAYGERYMQGSGELFLIYPQTPHFNEPLPNYFFSNNLSLRVVPFDLETDQQSWLSQYVFNSTQNACRVIQL